MAIESYLEVLHPIIISAQMGTILLALGSISLTFYILCTNELRNLDQRLDALNKAQRGIWNLGGRGVTISEIQSGKKNEIDYLYELNAVDRSQVDSIHGVECGKIDQNQPNTHSLRSLTKSEDFDCYLRAFEKVKKIEEDKKKIINNKRTYLKPLIIIFFLLGFLVESLSLMSNI
jgi:hypothetical protein